MSSPGASRSATSKRTNMNNSAAEMVMMPPARVTGVEEQSFLFGDFNNEEYDKFFLNDGVQGDGVEFLCNILNATKTWVEDGAKYNFSYLKPLKSEKLESCLGEDMEECSQYTENKGETGILPSSTINNLSENDSYIHENTTTANTAERMSDSNIVSGSSVEQQTNQDTRNGLDEKIHSSKPTSWASLFKGSSSSSGSFVKQETSNGPLILSVQMEDMKEERLEPNSRVQKDVSVIAMDLDERAHQLADVISQISPNYNRHHLQLRGLINRGNWCYINTTLQALLGVSPISHFYKSLKAFLNKDNKSTSTPLTDGMISFLNEFEPINPKIPLKKQTDDLRAGVAFEPRCVYDVLSIMKTSLSEKGRQEDAEEFLSFLLNGIHEELVALQKTTRPKSSEPTINGKNDNSDNIDENDNDQWEHVGPKNKSSTVRKAVIEESLIKHMFGGVIRSSVNQTGMKESTTLQPFFTLQLDIQSEKIWTLKDAIECYFVKENLQGFNCPKTKTEVEASRRLSIEELPMIFIFHLKYFVFDMKGGCQKLHKAIDIPVDLEIPKEVISTTSKIKTSTDSRKYKLYAVIYHHGKYAAGGHYTASVHHGNPFGWVHFDDNLIKTVTVNQVVKYQQGCVPYLLFYERVQAR